jgi:hypothetical protein
MIWMWKYSKLIIRSISLTWIKSYRVNGVRDQTQPQRITAECLKNAAVHANRFQFPFHHLKFLIFFIGRWSVMRFEICRDWWTSKLSRIFYECFGEQVGVIKRKFHTISKISGITRLGPLSSHLTVSCWLEDSNTWLLSYISGLWPRTFNIYRADPLKTITDHIGDAISLRMYRRNW